MTPYSVPFFYDLESLWLAWRKGIPPRRGMGVLDLPPRLAQAFRIFDGTQAKVENDRAEAARAQAELTRQQHGANGGMIGV